MPYPSNSLSLKPQDLEDLTQQVQSALPPRMLVPLGGGTKAERFTLPKNFTIISTQRLNNVLEYAPDDMTITVQAGITLAKLAGVLAQNHQRLPLDPPSMNEATVGGVLAANDSGPIRYARGTARDWVIGMRAVLGEGTIVKSGGKVVKNVAGYDLHKLMIGSMGSLGVIAEVTFKLTPIPESRRLVILKPPDAVAAERMLELIIRGQTRPAMLDLINARAARTMDIDAPPGSLLLVVGFEETAEAVDWQCQRLSEDFGQDAFICTEPDSNRIYEAIREWPAQPAPWKFKANMASSSVTGFFHQCGWHPISLVARAGNGVVYGQTEGPFAPELRAELLESTACDDGNLVYLNAPAELGADRWGRQRGDAFLMAGIKSKADPNRIFANGPFTAKGTMK
jgi:glycolate oxidase FAD binding subunit